MSLLNVRLPGQLPRVELHSKDKSSLMYALALAMSWGFFVAVHTSLM
jgi:hypothetical protein